MSLAERSLTLITTRPAGSVRSRAPALPSVIRAPGPTDAAREIGALVGGADIAQELAETGALRGLLEEKLGAGYADGAEEHVVDVLSGTRA